MVDWDTRRDLTNRSEISIFSGSQRLVLLESDGSVLSSKQQSSINALLSTNFAS